MRKYLLSIVLIFITVSFSQTQQKIPWPSLANSDWPMLKLDPQFTGRSPYKGPQTPTIVWTADLEDGIFSGPVIGEEGNLYFGTYYLDPSFTGLSDYFYSYSAEGNFLWEYKLGRNRPPQTGILIDSSNTIYFGSLDGYLYALNSNGTLKWEFDTEAPIFEVTMLNIDLQGNIYITNDNGYLFSVSPEGVLNWKVSYEEGFAKKSPVFSPDGETMYIAGGDSGLYAIGVDSELKWKFECGEIQRAPMVDSGGNIYFIPEENIHNLYSITELGSVRWKYLIQALGPGVDYSIPAIDRQGNIYFIGIDTSCCPYYRALISIENNSNFRWKYVFDDADNDDFWQPLICDSEGTIYVGSTRGNNYYAISNNGDLKWKLQLRGTEQQVDNTGAISKDGTLYIGVHESSLNTGSVRTLIAIRDTGVVSVNDGEDSLVKEYQLYQNYPNPFNPTTIIKFTIPNVGATHELSLRVYDVLGREVVTLINQEKPAGNYEIEFDGSDFTSGVYFYVLQSGNTRLSKKMLLIK